MTKSAAGYRWQGPERPQTPVIVSVCHAGRAYEQLLDLALHPQLLWRLEDRAADLLVDAAVAEGASALIATQPRAFVDLNREPGDLDWEQVEDLGPTTLSARAKHGLGLIPRRLAPYGELWRRKLTADELGERLAFHAAYHVELHAALSQRVAVFGHAILLDLHSMPPLVGPRPAELVLGDRYGKTAGRNTLGVVERLARERGLRVARNEPYAGGAIITRAARRPEVQAIQLELARPLYLDRALQRPGPGLLAMQALIAAIVRVLGFETVPLAAE